MDTRKTVYLDSTIPSYLFDERESIRSFVEVTKRWWAEERDNFNLVISKETIAELGRGSHSHKAKALECASELELLPDNDQLTKIVEIYTKNHLMPCGPAGDALHLAYASFYKTDFLLTWNCNHLANANKKQHITIINARLDLFTPEIVTPLQLFKETDS